MVFSDDFLHFLKIKKKIIEFTKTILWFSPLDYQRLIPPYQLQHSSIAVDLRGYNFGSITYELHYFQIIRILKTR